MAGWTYVPARDVSTVPTAQEVFDDGLAVGYNTSTRDAAILMSNGVTMGKCAYYNTGGAGPYNIGLLLAVKSTEYQLLDSYSTIVWVCKVDSGTYDSVKWVRASYFTSAYGDFNYNASPSTVVQLIDENRKDYIPYYATLQEALDALNDGVWEEISKYDLSKGSLTLFPEEFYFDGNEHYPNVTVKNSDDEILRYNTDYILSWSPDVITPGTKIVLAIGQGEYSGELQGTWTMLEGVNDPYTPGGTTVPSTGPTDGSWELPADDLAVGGSPFNDLATQLYRPYAMTAAQVASFSNQLWNTDILDIISRYFEKPTEMVISLMSFPFTVECENSVQINFNWISSWSSVYVLGHPITQEIQSLDFGYVDLERYSGLFYDYQPYSSVQLYLPYIGFVPLKMNEVVGKRIRLTYLVDVLSGDFTAVVETSALGTPEPEKTLPYIGFYQGNIARPMPLSQQDLFSLFKKGTEIAITGAVAATAGTVGAIEGLAAEKAVGEAVQFTEQGLPQAAEMAMGRAATSQAQSQSAYKTFRRFGAATAANSILSIGNASAPILRNGTIDGISGRTSGQEAFIVITVPNQNVPSNQGILGYPTNQPGPLSKFSGYTEVRDIRLKIPNATESEIAEIESIVRGGIVI